jgi:hypothetical protein
MRIMYDNVQLDCLSFIRHSYNCVQTSTTERITLNNELIFRFPRLNHMMDLWAIWRHQMLVPEARVSRKTHNVHGEPRNFLPRKGRKSVDLPDDVRKRFHGYWNSTKGLYHECIRDKGISVRFFAFVATPQFADIFAVKTWHSRNLLYLIAAPNLRSIHGYLFYLPAVWYLVLVQNDT